MLNVHIHAEDAIWRGAACGQFGDVVGRRGRSQSVHHRSHIVGGKEVLAWCAKQPGLPKFAREKLTAGSRQRRDNVRFS